MRPVVTKEHRRTIANVLRRNGIEPSPVRGEHTHVHPLRGLGVSYFGGVERRGMGAECPLVPKTSLSDGDGPPPVFPISRLPGRSNSSPWA